MPTKKDTFFGATGSTPVQPKLPTLNQFLKANHEITFPHLSGINLVWFPGTWDNYSVVTVSYRASIGKGHGLYAILDANVIKVFLDTHTQILLGIEDKSGTLRFVESNVYGAYESIGNAGVRFVPTEGAN